MERVAEIGVLALQGDFEEHEAAFRSLGAPSRQVRKPEHLAGLSGLILPGGESTTFSRLIDDFALYEPLRTFMGQDVAVWGTCAGMIILAKGVKELGYPTFGVIDIDVDRNAYGRQVDSFETPLRIDALGPASFPAVFIRAPVITRVGPSVEVLASLGPSNGVAGAGAVAVREGRFLATAFHPELTSDARFHRYFLEMVETTCGRARAR